MNETVKEEKKLIAYDFESESKNVYAIGYYKEPQDSDEEPTFVKVASYNCKTDVIKFYKASENLLLNPFLLQAIQLLKKEKPTGLVKGEYDE